MAKPKRDLPKRVPDDLADLDQAVMLLGNRAQRDRDLKPEAAKRLSELIGELPVSQHQAARWKAALKGLSKEMRRLGDTAPVAKTSRRVILEMPPRRKERSQRVFAAAEACAARPRSAEY